MAIVTGDRYLDHLVRFVDRQAGALLDGSLTLKLNPVGLHYVHSRLDALAELESLLAAAPVDYLRAYVSDLGDHRALEHLRRILRLLPSLRILSVLPSPSRDPTPLSFLPFSRLRSLELRGCDLSSSAARGLLDLRHTLEKLICHNSTDALRHVFASRIADVKESPAWTRLSFVSCACNGLVLMDESLQLLPAVETLDLSRNQFAKAANLRRCGRLRLLDLGFNHLRSISSFSEVSSRVVKLVLRNNALATLRGIENLKSVEGLDLSYNIISNFSELEILASLPSLQSLWLEGNPICCARWYRAHVFSFFSHPEKLNLDEKGISTREFWERHLILASRQKQPSGYGFYFPARYAAEDEGSLTTKRKKYCRLASIEDEEHRKYFSSDNVDQESVSCESDIQKKDENAISDSESEIVSLMNKVECMKKEQSVLWLRKFKEWLDETPGYTMDRSRCTRFNLDPGKENYVIQNEGERILGESSSYIPCGTNPSEGEGSSSKILDPELPDTDACAVSTEYYETNGKAILEHAKNGERSSTAQRISGINLDQDQLKVHSRKPLNLAPLDVTVYPKSTTSTVQADDQVELKISPASVTAIGEIMGSRTSSIYPGSPPHYQEDILQRRLYLEEEFLQLSADSQSLASSDSDTSCSDDDSCTSTLEIDHPHVQESMKQDSNDTLVPSSHKDNHHGFEEPVKNNTIISSEFYSEPNSGVGKCVSSNHDESFSYSAGNPCSDEYLSQKIGGSKKEAAKWRHKRRIVSLPENFVSCYSEPEFQNGNGLLGIDGDNKMNKEGFLNCDKNHVNFSSEEALTVVTQNNRKHNFLADISLLKTVASSLNPDQDEFIKDFFHMKLADSGASETCQQAVRCPCMHQLESASQESEVALLRSSKNNLYMLLIDAMPDGQETVSKVLGYYRLEELREVVVGLGLQALRVLMEDDSSYLFLPRSVEKFQDLLCLLSVGDSTASSTVFSLRSWEQVQVRLLEKNICGCLKMGIVLFSMLLFWQNKYEGEAWVLRSLFVTEGCLLLCAENLVQFSSVEDDNGSSPPYYSLDSCCPIQDIIEMVVELDGSICLTLTMNNSTSGGSCFTRTSCNEKPPKEENAQVCTWKLKWFAEEALVKFVAVLKAIHLGLTMSPLPVKCIS
ncbi:uncharacterized protein M6B38_288235 [Iris pallida]|uniref:Serine/threonine-protein kinase 11-interacting protein n=1 Tax=Iris pallida TaxID=29817 RepID=A0AAX6HXI4_IRIPA|nr:uncharacterized protein M6B38_288235 [Iris pallida]